MSVKIKLETFEGPLDLLLHLIQKSEMDIHDIPIAEVTRQYVKLLESMKESHLELASEFIVMAATLLSIKSKMLLPKPPVIEEALDGWTEEAEDPRNALVQKLLEYKRYKDLALALREREVERSQVYTREPEDLTAYLPQEPDNPVKGIQLLDLLHAFRKALRKAVQSESVAKIRRDEISVKDRMNEIAGMLASSGGKGLFSQLFLYKVTKEELVVTFLALLEMMKMKHVLCYQHQLFDDIVIQLLTEWEGGLDDRLSTDEIRY